MIGKRLGVMAWTLIALLVGACSPAPRERVIRIERPDTLPSAYAAVQDFCSPPADPAESPPADPPTPPQRSVKVPLGTVVPEESVYDTQFEYAMRCVVRSQAQLEALWALSEAEVEPPRIRFSDQVLILAPEGVQGSGFGTVRNIQAAWRLGDTAFIRVLEVIPGGACEAPAQMTWPAHAVRTHAVSVVRFEEVYEYVDCR